MKSALDPVGQWAMRSRWWLLAATLAVSVGGCGFRPVDRVLVPVSVPCKVDMPAKPIWATLSLAPGADIFDRVKALLAERRQRQGYEALLEAALNSCNASSTAASLPLAQ